MATLGKSIRDKPESLIIEICQQVSKAVLSQPFIWSPYFSYLKRRREKEGEVH